MKSTTQIEAIAQTAIQRIGEEPIKTFLDKNCQRYSKQKLIRELKAKFNLEAGEAPALYNAWSIYSF